ncbi:MAG TPA: DUF6263 family protein [Fimbriimonadaceae bacterium]|nr:DUF6263 family protein [Fimbriimonadaceae bacterium]
MRYCHALIAGLVSIVILAGCGPKTYDLKFNPKEGEVYNYATKVSGAANLEVDLAMKVAKVSGDQVVIETHYVDMKMNGQPIPGVDALKKVVMTNTQNRQGHVMSTDVSGAPEMLASQMKAQNSGTGVAYPDHPVKIGETWASESNVQGQKMTVTYKLVKVDSVNGKEEAFLEATPTGGQVKASTPMTLTVDLATGMPLETKFDGEVAGKKVTVQMIRT